MSTSSPDPIADPLEDLLRLCRIEGAVFARAEGRAPWGVSTRGAPTGIFHVVLQGTAVLRTGDPERHVRGVAGSILLLPRGSPHVLSDRADGEGTWIGALPSTPGPDGLPVVRAGPDGLPETSILCGTLRIHDEGHLLPHLPDVLATCPDGPLGAWVAGAARQLHEEARHRAPGAALMINRLAELLFVAALRTWIASRQGEAGVLAALGDPPLSQALGLIHGSPARPWSVDHLARRVGLSRTAFFERFSRLVGMPPAAYLAQWRMALARRALAETDVAPSEIARRVGYGSEAAFHRAFKREVGRTPGEWRRDGRQGRA